ncbi:consensus disorder prediction [Desulfoluna spongiiphila]|nr:consensus disorder prediction [Desulfoluna spongiiphila]
MDFSQTKIKQTKSDASGGKVSHLESGLPLRSAPRASGQITAASFVKIVHLFFARAITGNLLRTGCLLVTGCLLLTGCAAKTPPAYTPDDAMGQGLPPALTTTRPEPNHLALAKEMIGKGYHDIALVQLEKALTMRGEKAEIYHRMGCCHREKKAYEEAKQCFAKALAMEPDYAPAHNDLAMTLDLTGAPEAAQRHYKRAIEINPARPDFYNNMGFSHLCAGHLDLARDSFTRAITLDDSFFLARHNLALCLGFAGKEAEAMALLSEIMAPAEALNNMGAIHTLTHNPEQAADLFSRALAMDPTLPAARKNIAATKGAPQK